MGQYWVPVNLDKKEFVSPHKLATGLKLWEHLANHPGTGAALIVLLAAMPYERGGGDLLKDCDSARSVIGRWAGDRIALVGDYAEDSDLPEEFEASKIYEECVDNEDDREGIYRDITDDVCKVIEKELGGTFQGDGWREFVRNTEKETA